MPAKSLWKKVTRKWEDIGEDIERAHVRYARSQVLSDFRKIVAPFSTDIPFHVVSKNDKGDHVTAIEPTPGVSFIRESMGKQYGDPVPTAQLFRWLNEGTAVKHIRIIGPYTRGTSPSSLQTQGNSNNANILASKKYQADGIEPRNWTEFLIDKHSKGHNQVISRAIKTFFKSR